MNAYTVCNLVQTGGQYLSLPECTDCTPQLKRRVRAKLEFSMGYIFKERGKHFPHPLQILVCHCLLYCFSNGARTITCDQIYIMKVVNVCVTSQLDEKTRWCSQISIKCLKVTIIKVVYRSSFWVEDVRTSYAILQFFFERTDSLKCSYLNHFGFSEICITSEEKLNV